jgi:hypothetical protein
MLAGGFSAYTTFGGALTEFTKVYINGTAMTENLPILWNSSDIEGPGGPPDLISNLTDAIAFVTAKEIWDGVPLGDDIWTGPYQYKIDCFFDGAYNLSDAIVFAGGLNRDCNGVIE